MEPLPPQQFLFLPCKNRQWFHFLSVICHAQLSAYSANPFPLFVLLLLQHTAHRNHNILIRHLEMERDAKLQVGAAAMRDRNVSLLGAPCVGASQAEEPAAPPCTHTAEISCDEQLSIAQSP